MIRRNLLSRDDAIRLVQANDGLYPSVYMDKSLTDILAEYSIDIDAFNALCDEYTNYELFKQDSAGKLLKRADGSPELAGSYNDLHQP